MHFVWDGNCCKRCTFFSVNIIGNKHGKWQRGRGRWQADNGRLKWVSELNGWRGKWRKRVASRVLLLLLLLLVPHFKCTWKCLLMPLDTAPPPHHTPPSVAASSRGKHFASGWRFLKPLSYFPSIFPFILFWLCRLLFSEDTVLQLPTYLVILFYFIFFRVYFWLCLLFYAPQFLFCCSALHFKCSSDGSASALPIRSVATFPLLPFFVCVWPTLCSAIFKWLAVDISPAVPQRKIMCNICVPQNA